MPKISAGNLGIVTLAAINVLLWLLFPPPHNGQPTFLRQYFSEVLSSTAMILMSCALVLANRPRFLEPYFGGLDKMYLAHKNTAFTAIVLIFTHFATMPLSGTPISMTVGGPIGIVALVGLIFLVVLALAPRIPFVGGAVRLAYHHWRLTHKLIGVFFLIGLLHQLIVPTLIQHTPLPNLYFRIITTIGAAAYLYKELVAPFIGPRYNHVVEAVRKLNGTTLEVTLKPNGAKPTQTAGQFLFVSFAGDNHLGEPHPFTVSSAPSEANFRLSIKGSGDWTRALFDKLRPGTDAKIDGCYGMFNYKSGGPEQIWIAGGIGITPFLSWVRDFNGEPGHEIDFFYTVRGEADALFWDEVQAAGQQYARFRPHLTVSSKDGSLSTHKIVAATKGKLANKHIYMCGPLPMLEAFRKQFRNEGVPASQIHFEEFNFR